MTTDQRSTLCCLGQHYDVARVKTKALSENDDVENDTQLNSEKII